MDNVAATQRHEAEGRIKQLVCQELGDVELKESLNTQKSSKIESLGSLNSAMVKVSEPVQSCYPLAGLSVLIGC